MNDRKRLRPAARLRPDPPAWSERGAGNVAEVSEPLKEWPGTPASDWDREESENAEPQPVYLILMRLTNRGRRVLIYGGGPQRILEINHEVEQHGCEIISQFALLGGWDFATFIKAKDNLTIHAVARDLAAHGDLKTMTLPAIPAEEFVAAMKKGWPDKV
jgi:uncharacterized protein with GYD domain